MLITTIDLKEEHKKRNFSLISEYVQTAIIESLQKGKKVILLHNRIGYARRVYCKDCKTLQVCTECGSPLLCHDDEKKDAPISNTLLLCRLCKKNFSDFLCPVCQSALKKFHGYGIDRLKHDVQSRITKSVHSISAKIPNIHDLIVLSNEYDIVIGTHLPASDTIENDTSPFLLCAVINADTDFYLPDFRASVRVFNRLTACIQSARAWGFKECIIQTYLPTHFAITTSASHDIKSLYAQEIETRKQANYPPWSSLIKLICQKKSASLAHKEAETGYDRLKKMEKETPLQSIEISPPHPAFVPLVRSMLRYHIVIKCIKPLHKPTVQKIKTFLSTLPQQWL